LVLSGVAVSSNPVQQVFMTWINIGLASIFCLEAAGYLRAKLDREITTDPLTGVLNRSGLDELIDSEIARTARTGRPLTIALFDLDDFKLTNDRLGHLAGDRLLVDFAAMLTSNARSYDTVARIGGDEFLIVLPDAPLEDGLAFIERLRSASTQHWSVGLASARDDDTARSLRERADQQLYVRKGERKSSSA
jgi:diguanylate cyclase (GGDEF)-like protein